MSAREQILGSIRASLKRGTLGEAAQAALDRSLLAPVRNLEPARATALDPDHRLALFIRMAEAADASVARVADPADVPGAVAAYLARRNLPAELVMAPDKALDAYPWAGQTLLGIRRGTAEDHDAVGVTPAFAGIAETGTLMLTSGADRPTSLNFRPDTHIVVLRADQVVGTYEDGWVRLRAALAGTGTMPLGQDWALPRTVNLITGPSRTGDIEQTIQLGAHGPRRLHIVVVGTP